MFINFTNHPSSAWSKEQLTAAHAYGKVVDIPFPNIAPQCTKSEILHLVEVYVEKIRKIMDNSTIVHVMGEMTFTYNIVNVLKNMGITCLASTTERNIVITPDGKEMPKFEFVQFREY